MKVYEYKVKLLLKEDIHYEKLVTVLNYFIDSALSRDEELQKYHNEKHYKGYVHDFLYPVEKEGVYKKNHYYTMRIRSIEKNLIQYFISNCSFHETTELIAMGGEVSIVPEKMIKRIYSITSVIVKNDEKGYWKNYMSLEEFEKRLKDNLMKKYKLFVDEDLDENFMIYDCIEFKNKVPVKVPYKNIHLLGDKISIEIAQNERAQKIAYLALGTGVLENNSRGFGFMNYEYL